MKCQDKVKKALKLWPRRIRRSSSAAAFRGQQQTGWRSPERWSRSPRFYWLDEPLSNLDAKLRNPMRWELKELTAPSGDDNALCDARQVEALAISDEIALMNRVRIVQRGTPREIYSSPRERVRRRFYRRG